MSVLSVSILQGRGVLAWFSLFCFCFGLAYFCKFVLDSDWVSVSFLFRIQIWIRIRVWVQIQALFLVPVEDRVQVLIRVWEQVQALILVSDP